MPPRSASKRMPVAPTKFDASPKVSRESKLKASAAAVAEALEKTKAATEASAAKAAKTKAAEMEKESTPPPNKQTEKVEDIDHDSDASVEADRRKKKKSKNHKPERRTPEETAIYLAELVTTAVATALAKSAAAASVPETQPALDNQFVPYAAEDLMSIVTTTLSALPSEGGASSRSPFVTHGVRFVNSLAPAAQTLAESHWLFKCIPVLRK